MEKIRENYTEADWELITKFITGNCSDDEKSSIQNWINEKPARKQEIELLRKSFQPNNSTVPSERIQNAWNEVLTEISINKKAAGINRSNSIFNISKSILKVAAVLVIMLGVYFTGKQLNIFNAHSGSGYTLKEKVTALGEKAIITLSDGTIVTLNADSKLNYPNNFNSNSREIYLHGEAFFDVAHDSTKPFIVHTENISTTVLGTKFNISAFPNDKIIAVSLVEGKVKVSNEKLNPLENDIILRPMQELDYDLETSANTVDNFDLQEKVGWKDNVLKFKSEPLEKVLVKLERVYGIHFELADKSFNKFKITGNFHNESYYTVSESLRKLTGLQYKTVKENNETKKIIFYKK